MPRPENTTVIQGNYFTIHSMMIFEELWATLSWLIRRPLGLMGFGMTTILLNLHNVGYFALDGIILAMGIFYGGIAQIFAGLLEYKKGNTFGLTAFTSYGSFWLTLVAILLMPKLGLTDAPNAQFLGVYLGLWGVFTLFMFFGTLKGARVLQFVFFSLTVLFALLAIGNIVGNAAIIHFAGWIGLICGLKRNLSGDG